MRKQGEMKRAIQIAKSMLSENISLEQISIWTGLSLYAIRAIQLEIQCSHQTPKY